MPGRCARCDLARDAGVASDRTAEDYTIFVHLLGADGRPRRRWTRSLRRRNALLVCGRDHPRPHRHRVPAAVPPGHRAVGMYLLRAPTLPVRGVSPAPGALLIGDVEVNKRRPAGFCAVRDPVRSA
jgi:hypothetical protein